MKYRAWCHEMDRLNEEAEAAVDRLWSAHIRRTRWTRPEWEALSTDARTKVDRAKELSDQQPRQPLASMAWEGFTDWLRWSPTAVGLIGGAACLAIWAAAIWLIYEWP